MSKKNVIIIGAAGRDFHNFNTYYRNNDAYNVVAFTAAQIPDIEGRKYPAALSGKLYPKGIPIHAEEDLPKLIKKLKADYCVFSYSDVSYQHVMSVGAIVNAAGASFVMLGPKYTQIKSTKPVISVGAVRTGCGKSQTSRFVAQALRAAGKKVVVVGSNNSSHDISAALWEAGADVTMVQRSSTHIVKSDTLMDMATCRLPTGSKMSSKAAANGYRHWIWKT